MLTGIASREAKPLTDSGLSRFAMTATTRSEARSYRQRGSFPAGLRLSESVPWSIAAYLWTVCPLMGAKCYAYMMVAIGSCWAIVNNRCCGIAAVRINSINLS
jgi:hypothetical protein